MAEIKLKHCPFCGGEAKIRIMPIRAKVNELDNIEISVNCYECNIKKYRYLSEYDKTGVYSYINLKKAMEDVIVDWNRRSDNG